MAARENVLHQQAVETVEKAEVQIENMFDATEIKAAQHVAKHQASPESVAEARSMFESTHAEATEIAEKAIAQVNALMEKANDPQEAQRLTAIMNSAITTPPAGIRFSEHLRNMPYDENNPATVQAMKVEAGLNAVMQPFMQRWETAMEQFDVPASPGHDHALHSDTVDLFGTQIEVPGGLYTVVFAVLAVVTALEVLIAESAMPNSIAFPLLAALSLGKAVLVVLYYMHLREDSRIFVWAFGLPLAMASLIILFLMIVDPVAYAG